MTAKLAPAPESLSRADAAELDEARPRLWGECQTLWARAPFCPFAGCQHHLLFQVTARGALAFNHETEDPSELRVSCALDFAAKTKASGQTATLEQVGHAISLTRERVRQIEEVAIAKLRAKRDDR